MTEKPILFSTEMVRAILDGRKMQTRRVIKPQPPWIADRGIPFKGIISRPYHPGDILWVRETWGTYTKNWEDADRFLYRADYPDGAHGYWHEPEQINWCDLPKWKPSIYMPKDAARLFLKITDVRVERLWDITEDDAKAEGIVSYWAEPHKDTPPFIGAAKDLGADLCRTRKEAYKDLWDSLNAKRGYPFGCNPWVWVIGFRRVE